MINRASVESIPDNHVLSANILSFVIRGVIWNLENVIKRDNKQYSCTSGTRALHATVSSRGAPAI